jgi:hypothetical protein
MRDGIYRSRDCVDWNRNDDRTNLSGFKANPEHEKARRHDVKDRPDDEKPKLHRVNDKIGNAKVSPDHVMTRADNVMTRIANVMTRAGQIMAGAGHVTERPDVYQCSATGGAG